MEVLKKGKGIQLLTYIKNCPKCEAVFKYNNKDIEKTTMNDFVRCPECGCKLGTSQDSELRGGEPCEKGLTISNITFPADFSDHSGGAPISDKNINDWIQKSLQELEYDDEDFGVFHFHSSGDTFALLIKYEEEYLITVGKKNYYASIDRQHESVV